MLTKRSLVGVAMTATLLLTANAGAQAIGCEDQFKFDDATMEAYRQGPQLPPPEPPQPNPLQLRVLKYAALNLKHKLSGLASYYSTSLNGTLTATGEIFYNARFTAAHLTLPLGTWVEVKSRATGRTIRCRINDRGPYAKKFMLDLSQAAARALGVDRAEDRHVEVRVIALPGEKPLPENWEVLTAEQPAPSAPATSAPKAASLAVDR